MAGARWTAGAAALLRGFARPGAARLGRALLVTGALALPVAPIFLPAPAPLPDGAEIGPEALRRLLLLALMQNLALAGLALLGARLAGQGLCKGLGLLRGRLGPTDLGLLIVGMVALSHGLDRALALAAPDSGAALGLLNEMLRAARDGGAAAMALAVLAIGIAPGLCEELLFRGALQRWLQRRLSARAAGGADAASAPTPGSGEVAGAGEAVAGGAAGVAVVCSAAVFGALHWDPVHSPLAFLLGLYLGAAALLSGEVWTPIACHMANNLLAVAAGLWLPAAPAAGANGSVFAAVCGLVICLACLARVAQRVGRAGSALQL